jgi:hypothetical protein
MQALLDAADSDRGELLYANTETAESGAVHQREAATADS